MHKWQVFLGGIASATFVLAGAATPALAQTVTGSPLTSAAQALTGAQLSAQVCALTGAPLSGEVNSALAGLTGQSCTASSSNTTKNTSVTSTTAQNTSTATSTPMTSALPGMGALTGEIPGLGSMSSSLTNLASGPGGFPSGSLDTVTSDSNRLSDNTVPSLTSNEPGSSSTAVQNTLNGVTGALQGSSVTGGMPDLGGTVSGALSNLTGPQN